MRDVSERAGVSLSTVSRVLNDHATVDPRMRERVLLAVEELGYRPNMAARTLKTSRSRLIVFLVPEISNPYYTETYRGINAVAERRGYITLMYEATVDGSALRHILTRGADGVVIDAFYEEGFKKELAKAGIPFVQTNAPATMSSEYGAVRVDVFGATLEVLEYLSSLGHQSIGIIDSRARGGVLDERERAFRQYAGQRGISDPKPYVVRSVETYNKYRGGYVGMQELLRRNTEITAVLTLNDLVAVGAVAGARSAGLDVPGDISIVGFDNADIAQFSNPPLTTIDIPTVKQGEIAANMLFDLIHNPGEPHYSVHLQTKLIIRESATRVLSGENVY